MRVKYTFFLKRKNCMIRLLPTSFAPTHSRPHQPTENGKPSIDGPRLYSCTVVLSFVRGTPFAFAMFVVVMSLYVHRSLQIESTKTKSLERRFFSQTNARRCCCCFGSFSASRSPKPFSLRLTTRRRSPSPPGRPLSSPVPVPFRSARTAASRTTRLFAPASRS